MHHTRTVFFLAGFFGLAGFLHAATYYVSPTGNDSNNGTSTSTPWKTISKVNSVTLSAGDRVLFQGGQTFSGTTVLTLKITPPAPQPTPS
jgi:hypothetical protein